MLLPLCLRDSDQLPDPVIDLGPVDDHNITRIETITEVPPVGNAPKMPEIRSVWGVGILDENRAGDGFEGKRLGIGPTEHPVRPEISLVAAPKTVILRFF